MTKAAQGRLAAYGELFDNLGQKLRVCQSMIAMGPMAAVELLGHCARTIILLLQ